VQGGFNEYNWKEHTRLLSGEVLMQKTLMKKCRAAFLVLLAAALLLIFAGCGGNGSTPTFNISGNWSIVWTETSPTPGSAQGPYTFSFTQSGSSLSGTTSQGQAISGSISGQNVNFSFVWTETNSQQNTYTFTGSEGNNGTTMSGTWTIQGSNPMVSGQWSGTFIPQ
jgi:hypothetical protein